MSSRTTEPTLRAEGSSDRVPAAPADEAPTAALWLRVARPHILSIVFAATLTYGWIMAERFVFWVAGVAVWDWFIVNFINKATDVAEDLDNHIPGAALVARHKRTVEGIGWAMLVGGLGLGFWLIPALTGPRLLFSFIGLAYSYRLIPTYGHGVGFRLLRLKDLYFFKNFGSATLFTLSVFIYPLVGLGLVGVYPWLSLGLAIAFFVPLEITYEILYDLRDIDGDRRGNVPTFPVRHGPTVAKGIIYGLIALAAVAPVLGAVTGVLRLREWVVVAACVQQLIVMRLACGGDRLPSQRDSERLTYLGAAQLASYCAWVALGLPLGA